MYSGLYTRPRGGARSCNAEQSVCLDKRWEAKTRESPRHRVCNKRFKLSRLLGRASEKDTRSHVKTRQEVVVRGSVVGAFLTGGDGGEGSSPV